MVSVEEIIKRFGKFVKEISKKKYRKIEVDKKEKVSEEIRIFANLLEDKGFIAYAEELKAISATVLRDGKITNSDIVAFDKILKKLK